MITKKQSMLAAYLCVIVLGIIDHISGYEVAFSIFYVLPILFAVWYVSFFHAVILSVLSAVIWCAADLTSGHRYSHILIPLWNTVIRFMFFVIIVYLARGRKDELELEQARSRTDMLTEIGNYRYAQERLETEKNRSVRFRRPMTVVYVDVDNFKEYNDLYGHSEGDELLKTIAKTMKSCIRAYDLVARLGGDEFLLMFPETNAEQARHAVDNIRNALSRTLADRPDFLTFSMGVVTFDRPLDAIDEMIKMADNAMYSVKRRSKNSVGYEAVA